MTAAGAAKKYDNVVTVQRILRSITIEDGGESNVWIKRQKE
jgi:hypothetical protein